MTKDKLAKANAINAQMDHLKRNFAILDNVRSKILDRVSLEFYNPKNEHTGEVVCTVLNDDEKAVIVNVIKAAIQKQFHDLQEEWLDL